MANSSVSGVEVRRIPAVERHNGYVNYDGEAVDLDGRRYRIFMSDLHGRRSPREGDAISFETKLHHEKLYAVRIMPRF